MLLPLFFRSFFRQLRRSWGVSLMLFLGMLVSALCISITLGSAAGKYDTATGHSECASLTVVLPDDGGKTAARLPDALVKLFGDEIANVLYLAPGQDNTFYIGWQGYEQQRWFPHVSGRFFTHEEQELGADVVYLSMEMPEASQSEITIDGAVCQVVGVGWIVPFNIYFAIAKDSPAYPILTGYDTSDWKVYVRPYKAFLRQYVPVQVQVHFNRAALEELEEFQSLLQTAFPETRVELPPEDSGVVLREQQQFWGTRGLVLSLIAGITMVQLMREWTAFYRRELYIYHLCGLTRRRCRAMIYGQWFLCYAAAAGLALLVHRALFPVLEPAFADFLPRPGAYLGALLFLLLLTVAYSWRTVRACLDMTKRGYLL